MWPRVVEIMLGVWLALSPFVFRHPPGVRGYWINDFTCALIIITLSLLSFWHRTRHARLAQLLVAAWLIGFGYLFRSHPAPPALQNDVLVGWLLMMFAIMPNETNLPPVGWREYHRNS